MCTIIDGAYVAGKLIKFDWRVGQIASTKKIQGFPARTVVLYRVLSLDKKYNPLEIEIVNVPKLPEEINPKTVKEIHKELLSKCIRTFYEVLHK